ncbi:hypothetical protein ES332_D03G127000v1 [Gossypium tomentosum]|uniref:Uncharacterized protein n=1 Tax=Gossypium tomentosum TaxID=34277 RepID=A0A5D2LQG9_GOSTO|nr:hypothetical protein ES332_D03G127000v1 [Gossypium tomentosum]
MKTEAESTSHFPVKSNSLDSITSFNFSFQKHQVFRRIAISKKISFLAIFCRFSSSSTTLFNQDFVAIFLQEQTLLSSPPLETLK